VTKSGTNRFRGSLYDIERNSSWNSNSWANVHNGVAKPVLKQRDWGYTLGGPVGKPGGDNKLFFFFSQEWRPRKAGGAVTRFRVPTAAERSGDFSQSLDNNGNLYPYIKDPRLAGACSPVDQTACFNDGGALGRIPADRLYGLGLNILNLWPLPNDESGYAATNSFNYVNTADSVSSHTDQTSTRLDYQMTPGFRTTGKIVVQNATKNPNQADMAFGQGANLINGFNDAVASRPLQYQFSVSADYTINATTFAEVIYGGFENTIGSETITPSSNKNNVGLGGLPMLYPDAGVLEPRFNAYRVLTAVAPPWFQDGTSYALPNFSWGNRIANAPPNTRDYGCCLNVNRTQDLSASLTKIVGHHTLKGGYYLAHSWKAQAGAASAVGPYNGAINFGNDPNNPLDTSFGFANAALGVFTSYTQASKYVEGGYIFDNHEFYVQDNWRVDNRLTLDYGLRFVHQVPNYDIYGFASNFLPNEWRAADAPALYRPTCATTFPCSGQNVRAQNPLTGEVLGPGSGAAVGQLVPNSGNVTNGIFLDGTNPVPRTGYTWPALVVAPRFGGAYDVSGDQRFVVRGGAGLFFDRPNANTTYGMVSNPPVSIVATVPNATLPDLGSGLQLSSPPAVAAFEVNSRIPSSAQWNGGIQVALPWTSALDVEYVGSHAYHQLLATDINAPDFGAAYLPENQNGTLAASAVPGASALPVNFYRPYAGLGAVTQQMALGYSNYHSLQTSFSRRFTDGLSFGLNYTYGRAMGLEGTLRVAHDATNDVVIRPDNKLANYNLQAADRTHTLRATFVWDLPDMVRRPGAAGVLALVANDWQLSGVLSAGSGAPYSVGFSYQGGIGAQNLTGTPNYNARIVVAGDPGAGCSDDITRQFNTNAFIGPQPGSLGLESGQNYMRGCADHTLDLALARNIRLGGSRLFQIRVDVYNALDAVIINARNATMQIANLSTASTAVNLPYDANGNPIASRQRPATAGFGVATDAQDLRSVQVQLRFAF
jgi:hypothetical protein